MTTAIANQFTDVFQGIGHGFQTIVKRGKQLQGDAPTFGRIIRLVGYAFANLSPGTHHSLRDMITTTDNIVDNLQGVNAAYGLVNPKKEEQTTFNKVGNALFVGASVGSMAMWLDSCGAINLPKVAASTGGSNVLSWLTKSTLGTIVGGVAGVGYALMAIDNIGKLHTASKELKAAKTADEVTRANIKISKSWIDIAWMVSEAALKILLVVGIASTGALLAVGIAAAALGICSFLYSRHADDVLSNLKSVSAST